MILDALKDSIRYMLMNAQNYTWSLQGFGMLRLYLPNNLRLHIWNDAYRVDGVSDMHTHPWDFTSLILSGGMQNFRYVPSNEGDPYEFATIQCGPGGGLCAGTTPIRLKLDRYEVGLVGHTYSQTADEIHVSKPDIGTVTLVRRIPTSHPDHARVFWPAGERWVSAEPRQATPAEVEDFVSIALAGF